MSQRRTSEPVREFAERGPVVFVDVSCTLAPAAARVFGAGAGGIVVVQPAGPGDALRRIVALARRVQPAAILVDDADCFFTLDELRHHPALQAAHVIWSSRRAARVAPQAVVRLDGGSSVERLLEIADEIVEGLDADAEA